MSAAHIQLIAVFLIIFASVCIGFGEHYAMTHLVDFASTFGGGGVGILTGQKLSALGKEDPTQ